MKANTQKVNMTKDDLVLEIKKCRKMSFILGGVAYVFAFILVILMLKDYLQSHDYSFYSFSAIFAIGMFGIGMIFRCIYLSTRLKNDAYIVKQLNIIHDGGATPIELQKKWIIKLLIFSVAASVLVSIIIYSSSNGGGSGEKWDTCLKCGGDGKVKNELGYNISCPRCHGVGYIP